MCRSITRIILIGIVSLVGCGPITSQGLIKEARVAIDKAEKEGANIGAPYGFWGSRTLQESTRRAGLL